MTRVASLLPAATEIVALLDHEACLVGRSHECDWPPHVKSLPTPNIALIEWLDPPMSAGNWVPEMIHMAGAVDALKADARKISLD
jgi:iron complex transport system substrate-binding protein